MRLTRILVVLTAAMAAVFFAPAAAQATPAGTGWSASWEYYGANSIKLAVEVPGAKVVANGWDALGVRAMIVTLTDTAATDGKCAYLKWSTTSGSTEKWACNGSIQVTPPSADSDIVVRLCRDTAVHGAQTNCNPLVVPTSKNDEYIRTPGNGFKWRYRLPADEWSNDWSAWITIGTVLFDYYGTDNQPGGKRSVIAYLTTLQNPYICGSGKVLFGDTPSSATLCGDNQITNLPPTMVDGAAFGQGCIWAQRGYLDKHCVTMFVPEPS